MVNQLLQTRKRLNIPEARLFNSAHYDLAMHSSRPSARAICGHVEDDPKGISEWPLFLPGGSYGARSEEVAKWVSPSLRSSCLQQKDLTGTGFFIPKP